MKKTSLILIIAGVVLAIVLISYFSYSNKEISLRNQSDAQIGKIEGVYDKMWKVIQQKTQVTTEYKEAFKEIYPELIAGRYSEGELVKWVQEDNPEFDASLYKDLMQSIEILRTEFQIAQEKELDIIREHKNLRQKFPGSLFIGGRKDIEYNIISSTRSKEIMSTGLEDDITLWK